jgi:hypothetical protein
MTRLKRRLGVMLVTATAALAATGMGAIARRAAKAGGKLSADVAVTAPVLATTGTQVQAGGAPLQALRVWVHAGAVYPYVLHAMPGPAQVWIENQTQSEVTLAIDRVLPGAAAAQPAARVGTADHVLGPTQVIVLAAGSYIFYEQSNPSIKGVIEVRAP